MFNETFEEMVDACYAHIENCGDAYKHLSQALLELKETTKTVELSPKTANGYPWYESACASVHAARRDFELHWLRKVACDVPQWYLMKNVGRLALSVLILHFKFMQASNVQDDVTVPNIEEEDTAISEEPLLIDDCKV
jgi:hypothetical protein